MSVPLNGLSARPNQVPQIGQQVIELAHVLAKANGNSDQLVSSS
jgi:hypothetical protein